MTHKITLTILATLISFNVHSDIYALDSIYPTPEDNLIPANVMYIGTNDIAHECERLQTNPNIDWSSDFVLLQDRDQKYTYATCSRSTLVYKDGS